MDLALLNRFRTNFVIGVLIVASIIPLYIASQYTTFLNDDSYITLTYAKNLAEGNGFVFNHPPKTLGTTSPLFTLIVAGIGSLFSSQWISRIAVYITAVSWIGIVWVFFVFRSAWKLSDWQAAIIGLVIIASGWIQFLGMEAYVFSFLLVISISLFITRHYLASGFCIGLLFITRGEGILLLFLTIILSAGLRWYRRRAWDLQGLRPALYLACGFAVPAACWMIYAYAAFGTMLPNTLAAKQAQGENGLGQPFLQRLILEWMPLWGQHFTVKSLPFLNFWWIFIISGIIASMLRRSNWLIFLAWGALYTAGYTLLGVSAYWWYQLPILFVLNLFFALGIIASIQIISRALRSKAIAACVSLLLVGTVLIHAARPTITSALSYQGDPRGKSYSALSAWIRDHTSRCDSVAFIEIGYLGYYTNNRIIDLAGLTIPDIVPHVANGDFAWGFWHYAPDYYIYLPAFDWALAAIHNDPRFHQLYRPVARLPGPNNEQLVVYQRVSSSPCTEQTAQTICSSDQESAAECEAE